MRIAVCDDDEKELDHFMNLIEEYQLNRGINHECRFFHNSIDLLCNIKGGEYDLILLDVVMLGISGVQAAQEIRERDKNVKIIFVSSSAEFAVSSYSVGAYYYLLKPVDVDSLFPLLDRVERELFMQDEQGLVLKDRKCIARISFTELEYVEVMNKTVFFYLADGIVHKMTAALSDIEGKLLSRPEFIKTHRSCIVNLNYVQKVGVSSIVTKNEHTIPISRQRRNQVHDAYVHFMQQEGITVCESDSREKEFVELRERSEGPWKILFADDEPDERIFWADILRRHGCIVHLAENGEGVLKMVEENHYDCILLDVMIPDEDGYAICGRLHGLKNTPVIFLSCNTETESQMEGFAVGGIEYITKDTPAELFWIKVETRIKLAVSERTQLYYEPLLLDLKGHRAFMDGRELKLSPVEFDILWKISERTEHIFTPEEIHSLVWGSQPWDGGQMVQVNMSRLRRKLEKAWNKHLFIETVWGKGYRFIPTVR